MTFNMTGQLLKWTTEGLDEEDTIELFQQLIDSGLAWQLEGHIGRCAMDLINSGDCHHCEPQQRFDVENGCQGRDPIEM